MFIARIERELAVGEPWAMGLGNQIELDLEIRDWWESEDRQPTWNQGLSFSSHVGMPRDRTAKFWLFF